MVVVLLLLLIFLVFGEENCGVSNLNPVGEEVDGLLNLTFVTSFEGRENPTGGVNE